MTTLANDPKFQSMPPKFAALEWAKKNGICNAWKSCWITFYYLFGFPFSLERNKWEEFLYFFRYPRKKPTQKVWLRTKLIPKTNCDHFVSHVRASKEKTNSKIVLPQLKFVKCITVSGAWLINRTIMHLWHIYELPRAFSAYFHLLFILCFFLIMRIRVCSTTKQLLKIVVHNMLTLVHC